MHAAAQQRQDRLLLGAQRRGWAARRPGDARGGVAAPASRRGTRRHVGVNVAFAADRRRVAQRSATCSIARTTLLVRLRRRVSHAPGDLAPAPSRASTVPAQVRKSLAVKSSPLDLADVVVDVGRVDASPAAVRRRGTGTAPGRAGPGSAARCARAGVVRSISWTTPLLPRKWKRTSAPPMLDVAVAQRRQAERAVVARVLLVADADERRLQQAHDGRQHLAPGQARQPQVGGDAPREARAARAPNAIMRLVLVLVALLAPARVIAVLLAAARVAPGRLEVAVRAAGRSTRRSRPAGWPARGSAPASRRPAPPCRAGSYDRELGHPAGGPCRIFLPVARRATPASGGRRRGAGRRPAPRRPDRSPAPGSLHAPLLAAPRSQPRREPKDHYRPRLAVAGCWLPVYRVGQIPIICDPPDGRRHLVEQHGVVGGTTNGGRRVHLKTQQNRHVV